MNTNDMIMYKGKWSSTVARATNEDNKEGGRILTMQQISSYLGMCISYPKYFTINTNDRFSYLQGES